MSTITSKTVLFVTGAFVSHHCWDAWREYFEKKGYTTVAPPWPGKNGEPAALRSRHPDKVLASVTLPDLITYYTSIINQLPEKPIIIGHSFGGLITQLLLNKGLAAAAVAVHPIMPQGVIPYEFKFLKATWGVLGFFTNPNKTYLMSFPKWQYTFMNGMSLEEQKQGYDALVIPESKRASRGALTSAAYVDFKKQHNPLLIMAGRQDNCIPYTLIRRNYEKYKAPNSVVEFLLQDRNHYVLGLPTWQKDADYILNWLNKH